MLKYSTNTIQITPKWPSMHIICTNLNPLKPLIRYIIGIMSYWTKCQKNQSEVKHLQNVANGNENNELTGTARHELIVNDNDGQKSSPSSSDERDENDDEHGGNDLHSLLTRWAIENRIIHTALGQQTFPP